MREGVSRKESSATSASDSELLRFPFYAKCCFLRGLPVGGITHSFCTPPGYVQPPSPSTIVVGVVVVDDTLECEDQRSFGFCIRGDASITYSKNKYSCFFLYAAKIGNKWRPLAESY
ncbi:hypothetical protein TNIN_1311 [Trichonephila inaurata madagascariensis]|uniref:Uncharacterized protein n=1 Tax=Trichonephila inaurata madagascariensis TaxID=2747483 RepID=A0A8X6X6S5_9ARAC|nr:hypothetical protein TNIN_1311 [Trichonephila inaurata madagascariensis]